MMMGTMRQIEPVGFLPPSKEVLLEIQVSNFIKDFLFSGVDDCNTVVSSSPSRVDKTAPARPQLGVQSSSAFDGHARFGQKENNPTSVPCTSPWKPDISQQNEAVFVEMPTQASIWTDKIPSACQSASELDRSESERFSDNSSGPGEIRIKMDEQWEEGTEVGTKTSINNTLWKHPGKWTETRLGKATTGSEAGDNPVSRYQALAIEGREEKKMHIAQISRAETFPCKSKTQRERQFTCTRNDSKGVCDVETEIKHSCRKPPRPPPRLTRQSSSDGQKGCSRLLTRCASDTNLLLQSSRRAKMERKRKMAAAASTVTSLWALILTLFFAVAMIVQGVSSQGSRTLAMKTANASSAALSNTPPSVKINLPASQPKASLLDGGQGNSGFDSSKWTEEGEGDVQRERTTQALLILKGFDTQSSRTSIS